MWGLWLAVAHAAPGVVLADGVVLDPERATVYLAAPAGGVEAVVVPTGRSAWTSRSGDVPLASAGDLVVTWKDTPEGTIRVVGLDAARRGGTAVRCADVSPPAGLPAHVDARLEGSTTVTARVRDHQIEASWSIERHYAGGAEPPPEVLAASNRHWRGSGRCAMDGAWTDVAGPPLWPTDRETPVSLQGKAGLGQRFGNAWKIAYIAWEGSLGTLHLQTWDIAAAKQTSDLVLGPVSSPNAYPILSADGARVALVAAGEAPTSWVFDAASGQAIATLPVALVAWTVVGTTYVSASGAGVVAYDERGRELWQRAVRQRAYDGPYPP